MTPEPLPTVISHPFTCGRQSSITFQLEQLHEFKLNLKSSHVQEKDEESVWWNAQNQHCSGASSSSFYYSSLLCESDHNYVSLFAQLGTFFCGASKAFEKDGFRPNHHIKESK